MAIKKSKKIKNKDLFLVSTLGIIFDPKTRTILIGRRENDPYVKELSWCFPGGRPSRNDDLEKSVEKVVKDKTGLKVKNLGSIFSRIFKENKQILLIYYLCEKVGGKEKSAKDFKELKWVRPRDIQKYFTTSFDKRLKDYIMGLK